MASVATSFPSKLLGEPQEPHGSRVTKSHAQQMHGRMAWEGSWFTHESEFVFQLASSDIEQIESALQVFKGDQITTISNHLSLSNTYSDGSVTRTSIQKHFSTTNIGG